MPATPQLDRRIPVSAPVNLSGMAKRSISLELACASALNAGSTRKASVVADEAEDDEFNMPELSYANAGDVSTDDESHEATTPNGSIAEWSVKDEKEKMKAALALCGLGLERV